MCDKVLNEVLSAYIFDYVGWKWFASFNCKLCMALAKYDSLWNESARKHPFIWNEKRIKIRDERITECEAWEQKKWQKNMLNMCVCVFKMAYNKAKDGHVKHSKRINKISLSLALNQRWKCTRIPETGAHSLVVLAAISFPHNFGVCHFSREMTTVVPSYEYRCILNFLCAGWNVCRSTIFMASFFVQEKKSRRNSIVSETQYSFRNATDEKKMRMSPTGKKAK